MIQNNSKGPKNPFDKPLCYFQKTRQQTPIEQQREGDTSMQTQQKLVQRKVQKQTDDIQVHFGQQKTPSQNIDSNHFFSPQNQQCSERIMFRNESKEFQNARNISQQQPSLQGMQQQLQTGQNMQESQQVGSLSPNPFNKNLQSPQTQTNSKAGFSMVSFGLQFTCSNIVDTEYNQPEFGQYKADKSAQFNPNYSSADKQQDYKQYPTVDSQVLERSLSNHQLNQQKNNGNNQNLQSSIFQIQHQQKQVQDQKKGCSSNNYNNNCQSSSSASLMSDQQALHLTFAGTIKEESEQKTCAINKNNNNLIDLNDSNDEEFILDEKECKILESGQKNKYPNSSIYSKNNDYFMQESYTQILNQKSDGNDDRQKRDNYQQNQEDYDEDEQLGQEFISKNLDEKYKMIDRRISCASRQQSNSHDLHISIPNQNENLPDDNESYKKHLDNVTEREAAYLNKAPSLQNQNLLGSFYKNSRSTNTFSPKLLYQTNSQGQFALSSMYSINQQYQQQIEGENSQQHGFNSPSIHSTAQAMSFYPLTRNLSTNSFKTSILKKDKATFERSDSNRTLVDTNNLEYTTKKSVKFNQNRYVLNYDEDDKEKTDFQYDDQMFFSDDLEEDSQSLPQALGSKNQMKNPKITVLEKVSEKNKEQKMNSSLINSNIIFKESELISSQSSNLIATKKKNQQIGSLSSAINQYSQQEENYNNLNHNSNIQDIIQINQDSILLSQTYIPNNINHRQISTSKEDNQNNILNLLNQNEAKINQNQQGLFFNQLGIGINNTQTSFKSDNFLEIKQSESISANTNKEPLSATKIKNMSQKTQMLNVPTSQNEKAIKKNKLKNSITLEKNKHTTSDKKSNPKAATVAQNEFEIPQQNEITQRKHQSSEIDLKTNSVQSNLELIMAKIQITQSTYQQKQALKKKKGKTCSSSCNIFQLICN
ncbi:hypothetical protein TTHERM_00374980 (macronuclear) [Tetrahymena thermophila SB210]|uniref:Uncharacterized protein n=1 Tax=Tetrahymena thermophila (strain SB210) TaxID=312017 RepID=I7M750_TETTS|nr:hypothetical protein TTHERM_00374980 [Tetrahymena thermophila SB210]EAR89381.1 hypothetical protein TTHERM_00374980 [Tetrahymena thermophila SB210]|eukprot:XP_001009626.1 hypothetical protein TTHERM_00374980 [Tetrahymena thermophila SB210]